jgi:hypothetical protein
MTHAEANPCNRYKISPNEILYCLPPAPSWGWYSYPVLILPLSAWLPALRPARIELLSGGLDCISGRQKSPSRLSRFQTPVADSLTLCETLLPLQVKSLFTLADLSSMNSRPKNGKRLLSKSSPRTGKSFNFFRGCNTSSRPEWGTEITRFKVVLRRVPAQS